MGRKKEELRAIYSKLPQTFGIYQYKDKSDKIIYVGKAKNLRKRVSSYFTKKLPYGKLYLLVNQIYNIDFVVVDSEQEALLLENALIKQHQPRYNVLLKDDKTFPFICIKNERFPRIFLTRSIVKDGSEYLGPYTSVYRARTILEFLLKLFPVRNCKFNLSEKNIAAEKFKVCLEYHIGNCGGPCMNLQTEEEYNVNVTQIKNILKGNYSPVIAQLKDEISHFSEHYEYEKAQKHKEKLEFLQNYKSKATVVNPKIGNLDILHLDVTEKKAFVSYFKVANGTIIKSKMFELVKKLDETNMQLLEIVVERLEHSDSDIINELVVPEKLTHYDGIYPQTIPKIGDKKKLLDLAYKNAMHYRNQKDLKHLKNNTNEKTFRVLNQIKSDFRLKEIPYHIECFDNSNFQGSNPVSSMVLFRNGKPAKSEYRHYNIKTVVGPDDFASMYEVVKRRYRRLIDEQAELPQLIIIDGGKGQLSSAYNALIDLKIEKKLVIVGIAKRLEEIYYPNDSLPLMINKKSISLKITQQLRNEAHRFAINFHRKKRMNRMLNSEYNDIPDIGPASVKKLFIHFKSSAEIKSASLEELAQVLDIKKAEAIRNYFDSL